MLRAHTAPVSLAPAAVSLRARRGRAPAPLCAIGPSGSYTSSGLALSGSVMNTSAFTIREDVKVTRSEEGANTTVTIKVRAVKGSACGPQLAARSSWVRGYPRAPRARLRARCARHGVKSAGGGTRVVRSLSCPGAATSPSAACSLVWTIVEPPRPAATPERRCG